MVVYGACGLDDVTFVGDVHMVGHFCGWKCMSQSDSHRCRESISSWKALLLSRTCEVEIAIHTTRTCQSRRPFYCSSLKCLVVPESEGDNILFPRGSKHYYTKVTKP